jgi:hypothetical protein
MDPLSTVLSLTLPPSSSSPSPPPPPFRIQLYNLPTSTPSLSFSLSWVVWDPKTTVGEDLRKHGLVWTGSGTNDFRALAPWSCPPILLDSGEKA